MIDIIVTILCIIGVYGFFSNNFTLLIMGCIASLIGKIIAITTGQFKGLLSIIGFIIAGVVYSLINQIETWMGVLIGLCFEQAIMGAIGLVMLLIITLASLKHKNNA